MSESFQNLANIATSFAPPFHAFVDHCSLLDRPGSQMDGSDKRTFQDIRSLPTVRLTCEGPLFLSGLPGSAISANSQSAISIGT